MVVVVKKKGETEDRLIARFRKKVVESGVLQEARDNQRFVPPSEKKKERKKRIKFQIELEKKRNY